MQLAYFWVDWLKTMWFTGKWTEMKDFLLNKIFQIRKESVAWCLSLVKTKEKGLKSGREKDQGEGEVGTCKGRYGQSRRIHFFTQLIWLNHYGNVVWNV